MKQFLLRTALFIALTAVLMSILDITLSWQLRQRRYDPYACWNDIFQHRINADLLIMGNSRAWVQYSPMILDSVLHTHSYNLGQNASAFNRQYSRYRIYRRHYPKPKIIIQNIDALTLSRTSGTFQYQYFPYFYNPDVLHWIVPYEQFTLPEKILPFYRYSNFGLNNLFENKDTSIFGYSGKHWTWTRVIEFENNIHFETDSETLKTFENFLAETRSDSIQVILVYAPIHSDYTLHLDNIDEMWRTYSLLSTRYGIPILNYQDDTLCFSTDYFYNYLHLNIKGAEIFSRHLAEDLKKMGLEN